MKTVTKTKVNISHGQSFKQSLNYQTAEASYHITREVADDPESIQSGFQRLERIVEKRLTRKMKAQLAFLEGVGKRED